MSRKARLAGLLHDIMKNEDKINLLQFIGNSDILLSVAEKTARRSGTLSEGFVCPRRIKDRRRGRLNAIRYPHRPEGASMRLLSRWCIWPTSLPLIGITSMWRKRGSVPSKALHIGMLYSINFLIPDLVKRENMLHQDTVDYTTS